MSIKDIMPNAVLRSKAGYPPPLTHPRYSAARDPQDASPRTLMSRCGSGGLQLPRVGQLIAAPGSCVLLSPRLVQGGMLRVVYGYTYPIAFASWVVYRLPRMVQSHRQILGQALCCSTYIFSNGSTGFSPYN